MIHCYRSKCDVFKYLKKIKKYNYLKYLSISTDIPFQCNSYVMCILFIFSEEKNKNIHSSVIRLSTILCNKNMARCAS